jgi:polyisoprenoid-binding protein YceI
MPARFHVFPQETLMRSRFFLVFLALFWAAPALAGYRLLRGPVSGTYRIDPQHTEVIFTIGHVGIANFTGRFDRVRGTYTVDSRNPAFDRARIVIAAASIDTGFAPRDADLRSPEFFDTARYPRITFVSTRYRPLTPTTGLLYGKLTMHGVTRAVVFHVRREGAGDVPYLPKPWGGYLSGFVATTRIKRSWFGMDAFLPEGLSNSILVVVNVEGEKIGPP